MTKSGGNGRKQDRALRKKIERVVFAHVLNVPARARDSSSSERKNGGEQHHTSQKTPTRRCLPERLPLPPFFRFDMPKFQFRFCFFFCFFFFCFFGGGGRGETGGGGCTRRHARTRVPFGAVEITGTESSSHLCAHTSKSLGNCSTANRFGKGHAFSRNHLIKSSCSSS